MKIEANRSQIHNLSNYRAGWLTLMCIAIVGLCPLAIAETENALPELPSITVKGQWAQADLTMPVLAKNIKPRGIHKEMQGTKIHMYFQIGTDGEVSHISSSASRFNHNESELKRSMKIVLEKWKFQPSASLINGKPVAIKVSMPVVVVGQAGGRNSSQYAVTGGIRDLTLLAVLD